MYRMTSYFTGVDFILDRFPAFWQEWLNIFLKLSLQYAIDSIIQLFIKSQAMKWLNTHGLGLKKTRFQSFYTPFTSRFLLWFEFRFVFKLNGLE